MNLLIARHGAAVDASENPSRPLSVRGTADVRRVAAFLARAGVGVRRVVHSGKDRARETAAIYAAVIGGDAALEEVSGLKPGDDPGAAAALAEGLAEDTLIVGHLPHLGRLVQRLTGGSGPALAMTTASVVCLTRGDGDGGWAIAWMLDPKLVP